MENEGDGGGGAGPYNPAENEIVFVRGGHGGHGYVDVYAVIG